MEWKQGAESLKEVRSGDYTVGYYEHTVNRRWLAHYKGARYDTRIGNKEGYATKEEAMEACELHYNKENHKEWEATTNGEYWIDYVRGGYKIVYWKPETIYHKDGKGYEPHYKGYLIGKPSCYSTLAEAVEACEKHAGTYRYETPEGYSRIWCENCGSSYIMTNESESILHSRVATGREQKYIAGLVKDNGLLCCDKIELYWIRSSKEDYTKPPVDITNLLEERKGEEMMWKYVTRNDGEVAEFTCDGCGKVEYVEKGQGVPEGWTSGEHLCPKCQRKDMEIPKVYKVLLRKDDGTLVSPMAGNKGNASLMQEAREAKELTYSIGGVTYAPEGSDGIYVQNTLERARSFREGNGYLMKPGDKVIVEAIPLGKEDGWGTYPAILVTSIVEEIGEKEAEKEYTVRLTDSEAEDIKTVIRRARSWGVNDPLRKLHTALGSWS